MAMVKTEKSAIKKSIEIWTRLAEEGGDKTNEELDLYNSGCPCCQYYISYLGENRYFCESETGRCPLKDKSLCGFNADGSAYDLWDGGCHSTSKEHARVILNALKEYYKLKGWK